MEAGSAATAKTGLEAVIARQQAGREPLKGSVSEATNCSTDT